MKEGAATIQFDWEGGRQSHLRSSKTTEGGNTRKREGWKKEEKERKRLPFTPIVKFPLLLLLPFPNPHKTKVAYSTVREGKRDKGRGWVSLLLSRPPPPLPSPLHLAFSCHYSYPFPSRFALVKMSMRSSFPPPLALQLPVGFLIENFLEAKRRRKENFSYYSSFFFCHC